jgi:hypothetical protein
VRGGGGTGAGVATMFVLVLIVCGTFVVPALTEMFSRWGWGW